MLTFDVSVHTLPKAGTNAREFEDAFAFDVEARRAAVADGASEAFEAGTWARLLVASYLHAPPEGDEKDLIEWLEAPAKAWDAFLRWEKLPWYADEKARTVGGLATLLGLSCVPSEAEELRWEAMAVGDACLIQLRDKQVMTRFPVEHTADFGSTPDLVATLTPHNEKLLKPGTLRRCQGTCRAGDLFLLATDAVAQWLYSIADLEDPSLGFPNWDGVLDVVAKNFKALIEELRGRSVMRNDDATLLVIEVVEAGDEYVDEAEEA